MQGNGPSGGTSESNEALLVMHFICTSMREVSCWSTITGKVDFERFEVRLVYRYIADPRLYMSRSKHWMNAYDGNL